MEQAEQNAPEPTLLDLAATLDTEGMVGFHKAVSRRPTERV